MALVTQFQACAFEPEALNQVLADYVALERLRVFRRLLVRRFGALSLVVLVIGTGLQWISPVTMAASLTLFLIPPVWACVAEFRFDRALDRRLERIAGIIHTAIPPATGRQMRRRQPNGKS